MLTPSYLEALPNPILDIYEEYIQSVLNDIARRLKNGSIPSATWQMDKLIQSGLVYDNAIKQMAKLSGKTEQELIKIFQEAGIKSLKFDDAIYKAAGLNPLPLNMSPVMVSILKAGLAKTNNLMTNLTSTTALTSQQAFIKAADLAYMQVVHGTMDYDSAIKSAIHQASHDGIDVIHYASGTQTQVDAAMRRTVLTGVAQTANRLQDERANELGVDLVATSAHAGSRPSHQEWQGKIFSRSGKSTKYPNFATATGYGTGAGLGGWNCRHSWYPFFEGLSENAYSQAMLGEMNDSKVMYQGKTMTQYEASQIQRGYERTIRNYKREAKALTAAGYDNSVPLNKVKSIQAELRRFTRQTGLDRQYQREGGRVLLSKGKQAPPAPPTPPPAPPVPPPTVSEPLQTVLPKATPVSGPLPPTAVPIDIEGFNAPGKITTQPVIPQPVVPPSPVPPPKSEWDLAVDKMFTPNPFPDSPDYVVDPNIVSKFTVIGKQQSEASIRALKIVESIHGDGPLPKADLKMMNSFGKKNMTVTGDYGRGVKPIIRILRREDVYDQIETTLHELGHFIDNRGLPGGKNISFMSKVQEYKLLEKWHKAVMNSEAYQSLLEISLKRKKTFKTLRGPVKYDLKFTNYLLSDEELFARSYAQYIAMKSGDSRLIDSVLRRTMKHRVYAQQWTTEDFQPIFEAMDELFKELGWLK